MNITIIKRDAGDGCTDFRYENTIVRFSSDGSAAAFAVGRDGLLSGLCTRRPLRASKPEKMASVACKFLCRNLPNGDIHCTITEG